MSSSATSGAGRRLRLARGVAADFAVFAAATAGAFLTQANDRLVSSAMIYLVGVMVVGARSGLVRGLLAALAASFIYNAFLSEPIYQFRASTLDELVPLVAFNFSAMLTGALAGRLNDRAREARAAEAKGAYLLRLSDRLQQAISVTDVARIAREALPYGNVRDLEVYLKQAGRFVPVGDESGEAAGACDSLGEVERAMPAGAARACPLIGSEGEIGGVCFTIGPPDERDHDLDLQGIANILALAVERCLLLDQLAEGAALQRSEELKSAILSSVSHDLRTPLTVIEAAAASLRSYEASMPPAQKAAILGTISEQCGRLNRYTANLLHMGRIQSGIPAAGFTEVDIVEILGVVLAALRATHPRQQVVKEILADSALVRANPVMLEQLIYNLVDNAVVHGASASPIVIRLAGAHDDWLLEVIDFGPGIPEDDQPRVFERFFRAGAAAHRQGSGLGLHIAHGFAEAFGGDISIASPHGEGIGTRMTVRLPMAADRHEHIGTWE